MRIIIKAITILLIILIEERRKVFSLFKYLLHYDFNLKSAGRKPI